MQTSLHGTAANETNRLVPDNILDAKDRDINKLVRVDDTFRTRHSVNPRAYPQEFGMLMAYPRGSKIHVTYFFNHFPDEDHESAMSDFSVMEHHLHKDLTEVRKFELTMLSQMETSFKEEDNTWEVNIEALAYPGRDPHMGDQFLYEVGNDKILIFQVNNVVPTTYRQGSYFRITAHATKFCDHQDLEKLRNCVTDVYYFDRYKYFDDGRIDLLTHDSYILLKRLEKLRKEIVESYMNRFYREDWETVVYDDEIYDPYLVEYLKNKVQLADYHRRPEQIDTTFVDYHKSLWFKLSTSVAPEYWDDVVKYFYIDTRITDPLSPTNNRLDNSKILRLFKSNAEGMSALGLLSGAGDSDGNSGDGSSSESDSKFKNRPIYKDLNIEGKVDCGHQYDGCSYHDHHNFSKYEWNYAFWEYPHYHSAYGYYDLNNSLAGKESLINSSLYGSGIHSGTSTYVFSDAFYSGIKSAMTPYELLVYKFLQKEFIDATNAVKVLLDFRKLSDEQKFYILPALLAVIDFLIIDLR